MRLLNIKKSDQKDGGFIKEIVLILVALIALRYYFHVDVVGYLQEKLAWLIAKL